MREQPASGVVVDVVTLGAEVVGDDDAESPVARLRRRQRHHTMEECRGEHIEAVARDVEETPTTDLGCGVHQLLVAINRSLAKQCRSHLARPTDCVVDPVIDGHECIANAKVVTEGSESNRLGRIHDFKLFAVNEIKQRGERSRCRCLDLKLRRPRDRLAEFIPIEDGSKVRTESRRHRKLTAKDVLRLRFGRSLDTHDNLPVRQRFIRRKPPAQRPQRVAGLFATPSPKVQGPLQDPSGETFCCCWRRLCSTCPTCVPLETTKPHCAHRARIPKE